MRWLYSAFFYLAVPALLLRLWHKGHANPAYRLRWRERFAFPASPSVPGVIWLHAVSVGETEAAAPLVRALQSALPHIALLFTTTTPTGSARASALFGEGVQHVYLPYDLPDAVSRFLDTYRPRLAVFIETEIWPNWFAGCAARGIPLVIANARLSEKSCRGYGRLGAFMTRTLGTVRAVAAQTETDAARFERLGVAASAIHIAGNLKFDRPAPQHAEDASRLREYLFGVRPVWLAASTHEGEEALLIQVHRALLARIPDLLLVLAPRHPERGESVAALVREEGLGMATRSQQQPCSADDSVFLLDTLGELGLFFGVADVAFVAGSLVPIGGHNVLEPAVLGVPVLFGPFMHNFQDIAFNLLRCGGARQVADGEELCQSLLDLLADPDWRAAMGTAAASFVAANRGAVDRHLALLTPLLSERNQSLL